MYTVNYCPLAPQRLHAHLCSGLSLNYSVQSSDFALLGPISNQIYFMKTATFPPNPGALVRGVFLRRLNISRATMSLHTFQIISRVFDSKIYQQLPKIILFT